MLQNIYIEKRRQTLNAEAIDNQVRYLNVYLLYVVDALYSYYIVLHGYIL